MSHEQEPKHHADELKELKEDVVDRLEALEERIDQEIQAVEEQILDEIVDIEGHCHEGHRPPRARGYRIRVNGDLFIVHKERPTGREIMEIAGIAPMEKYGLYIKVQGQSFSRVQLDDVVDLRAPGVEKFKTLPLDQTDGCHGYTG